MQQAMCLHTGMQINGFLDLIIITIKRRSGINPIPPTVKDRN